VAKPPVNRAIFWFANAWFMLSGTASRSLGADQILLHPLLVRNPRFIYFNFSGYIRNYFP